MDQTGSMFLFLLAPACGWCAGFGLFRTLLALALLHKFAPGGALPGALGAIGNPMLFTTVILLGLIEIVADAIPYFDTRWDRIQGKVRVVGGGTLAWLASSNDPVISQILFAIIGIFLALYVHSIHGGARRAAVNAGTANIVTPVTSLTELCMIFAALLPLSAMPALTLLMLGFMALASMMVAYLVWPEVSLVMREVFTLGNDRRSQPVATSTPAPPDTL